MTTCRYLTILNEKLCFWLDSQHISISWFTLRWGRKLAFTADFFILFLQNCKTVAVTRFGKHWSQEACFDFCGTLRTQARIAATFDCSKAVPLCPCHVGDCAVVCGFYPPLRADKATTAECSGFPGHVLSSVRGGGESRQQKTICGGQYFQPSASEDARDQIRECCCVCSVLGLDLFAFIYKNYLFCFIVANENVLP